MSYPFIIWTFQRTGGTTLSAAMSNAFLEQGIKHEPFNREREFGSITKMISDNKLTEGTLLLDQALDNGECIKHCFELHSKKFNKLFLERLSRHNDYRHIVLMREAETERLCSLFLAQQTAVWGKWKVDKGGYNDVLEGKMKLEPFPIDTMLQHARACLDYRKWLVQELHQRKMQFKEVTFEDLYSGSVRNRHQTIQNIFEFVGAEYNETKTEVTDRLFSGGQNSDRLFSFVPNFKLAWDALNRNAENT